MRVRTGEYWRAIGVFFAASFLLHLLWENLQAPLYHGYTSFGQHFWICLRATATGDMAVMLALYLALALAHRDLLWASKRTVYTRPITWLLPVILGLIFAVGMEMWALQTHRWAYAAMPMVFGIGLLPILQMIAIPPLALFFSRSVSRP